MSVLQPQKVYNWVEDYLNKYTVYPGIAPGNAWFVDSGSGSDTANGKSKTTPLATIDAAIGKCTASNGDVIFVLPGHAESVIAAAGIVCDIAGVSIVGLGNGNNRPTITFATADTATITVTAANVTITNMRFIGDIDGLAVAIPVTAAYCTIANSEFIDLGTDNAVDWITLAATADDFRCLNCINKGTDTAGNDSFITMAAASNVQVVGLTSNGNFAAANIECTAAPVDLLVADCYLENANAVDVNIEGFALATGWIARNCCRNATDGQVTWIKTPGAMSLFENYGVNADGETGMIAGTVSTA